MSWCLCLLAVSSDENFDFGRCGVPVRTQKIRHITDQTRPRQVNWASDMTYLDVLRFGERILARDMSVSALLSSTSSEFCFMLQSKVLRHQSIIIKSSARKRRLYYTVCFRLSAWRQPTTKSTCRSTDRNTVL